jgi:hypothetical protein
MKAYGTMKDSFIIIDIGTRWRGVLSFKLLPLYPRRKSHEYPLDRGWMDSRVDLDVTKKRTISCRTLKIELWSSSP